MATRVDRGKKVLHMMPDGGRDVLLEFLFSLVLGVLFQLVGNVLMNRLSATEGNKVISHHARLERSFVAVECRAPWILWIRGLAPTAVLPHDSKILEIEGGCLGIGNVGLALLIDKDSTGGINLCWPAQSEHPPCHIKHVDAHVTHNAVPILHKRAPAAGVNQAVIRPHWSRTSPGILIQIRRRRGIRGICRRARPASLNS